MVHDDDDSTGVQGGGGSRRGTGSDTTYSGGGSDTDAGSGVTGDDGSGTSYGGGGSTGTDAPEGDTGAADPGGGGGDDDDNGSGVVGGGGDNDYGGGSDTTYSGGGSDTTAGSGVTGSDGDDTTYAGGGGDETTTQTGSGVTGDDSGGQATEPADETAPADTDPDRLDGADRGYSVTRQGEPGEGGQLERSERAQQAARSEQELTGGLEEEYGALSGKEGRLASQVQQLQARVDRETPVDAFLETDRYNIRRANGGLAVAFADNVGEEPTPTQRRQGVAQQVASRREGVAAEDVTVTSTASGYTAVIGGRGGEEAVVTGAPDRGPIETDVRTGQQDRGTGVTRGPEGTTVVRPGLSTSDVTRYSQRQLNAQRAPSRGEVAAAVTAYGQRQLTQQNRITGRFEDERLVDDTDAGTMLTAQDQFSTGQRRQVAASVPAGAPLDLGDVPVQFPETERQPDARLTASDAAGTGTRDEVAATGDTERVETILQRRSQEFVTGAGALAAQAQSNREVSDDLERRYRAADTRVITGGTEETARAAGQGVARFVDPYGAAAGVKSAGETAGFVAGVSGQPGRAGGVADRANIAAGQVAAGTERTGDFLADNPRQALAGGAAAAAATVGAPIAAGRAASVADLTAEFDPRIGPFGETLESRGGSRLRAIATDDRAQVTLGTGRQRRGGDSGGDGLPVEIQEELSRFERAQRIRGARQRAEERVRERQQELGPQDIDYEPDTVGEELGLSGPGGRTVSRGVDTSRSGPTPQQRAAFRSSRTSTTDSDLSPRERQLQAQRGETGRRAAAQRRSVDEADPGPDAAALTARVGTVGFSTGLLSGPLDRSDAAAARSVSEADVETGARERLDTAAEERLAAGSAVGTQSDAAVETAITVDTDARVDTGVDSDLRSDLEAETDTQLDTDIDQTERVDIERDLQRDLDLDLDIDFRRDVDVDAEREPDRPDPPDQPRSTSGADQGRYRYGTPELF